MLYLVAVAVALRTPACKDGRNDPVGTAVEFERHMLSGDVWKAYPVLSSADTAVLPRRGFPENAEHVGISTTGVANATVDSAPVIGATYFDTVTVEVFLTVHSRRSNPLCKTLLPEGWLPILLQCVGVSSGRLAHYPESANVVLGCWSRRITSGECGSRPTSSIRETYLELPLRTRANWASRFLNSARAVAHVVPDEVRQEMLTLIRQAAIADSLRISARVQERYFSSHLEGTVINRSSAHIEELWFKVRGSNGTTQTVMVSGIPAHSTERYYEMVATVSTGRYSIDVVRLEILGGGR